MTSRLQCLQQAGVSIWLDTLSRDLLDSGTFATLIRDRAITGATSNPTIFAKAITGSETYDTQLRALLEAGGGGPQELFFELGLRDIRRAAAALRAVHESSAGADGFVSFECTPDLAHDAEATIAQATQLSERLALPNVMIKVPATAAGVSAIEELTARGVNINVSRYRQRFAGPRWEKLREHGATAQRPLWASTGPKAPAYSDVLYLEQLVAPDVINTMPEATLGRNAAISPWSSKCEASARILHLLGFLGEPISRRTVDNGRRAHRGGFCHARR